MARGRAEDRKGTGPFADLTTTGGEAARLVVDYVRQETLDPIKGLGRYLLFGIVGSVALAVGLVVLAVGLLRVLQGETNGAFAGNLSWAPYLICTVVVLVVAALAAAGVVRGMGRDAERSQGGA